MASEWLWMPHTAHFICGKECQFHLATYVNGVIVSTVGELWFDSQVREILWRRYIGSAGRRRRSKRLRTRSVSGT